MVVDLGCKAGGANHVEANVPGDVEGETVWADDPLKGDKLLALLAAGHALDRTNKPGSLR